MICTKISNKIYTNKEHNFFVTKLPSLHISYWWFCIYSETIIALKWLRQSDTTVVLWFLQLFQCCPLSFHCNTSHRLSWVTLKTQWPTFVRTQLQHCSMCCLETGKIDTFMFISKCVFTASFYWRKMQTCPNACAPL